METLDREKELVPRAMVPDLKFQELAAKLPSGSIFYLEGNQQLEAGIYVRVDRVTGDSYVSLGQAGVIEFVIKLILACVSAQNERNASAQAGQRLAAFQAPVFGQSSYNSSSGQITTRITCSVTGVLPVGTDTISSPLV